MKYILYRNIKNAKYLLDETCEITIPWLPAHAESRYDRFLRLENKKITIRQGYAWDGPSGPTKDTSDFMRGSLVHDALYQLIRIGKLHKSYRKAADQLLRVHCIEDGMSVWYAWIVYLSVRCFGFFAVRSSTEKQNYMIRAPRK